MTLLTKTISYIKYKRKGIRNAFKLAYEGKLSAGDYYCVLMLLCVIAIMIVLRLADYIDQLEVKEAIMRQAAMDNQQEAIRREQVIVSILNGSAIINGRIKTFCMLDASGQCKK